MRFDVDLHRTTLRLNGRVGEGRALEMSVVDAGPSEGDRSLAPTMVFIHGFGGRAAYWSYQLEQFQNDYRVIALDLRGHGLTDAPTEADGADYSVEELVDDIVAALDALHVAPRYTLVCHSFGGALSAILAERHKARIEALVIIASAVRFQLRWAGRALLRTPPALLTWLREVLPFLGFDAAKRYPPAHVVYLQNRNALTRWDGTEALSAIRIPTLVILGHRDALFSDASYKDVARLIPGAEQVVIPVSAHQVMVERPDAVNRAIERFLGSLADPAGYAERKQALRQQRREALKALEAERPWLKFYDSRTPYHIRPPAVSLPKLLEATARRFGATVAVDYFGGQLTWRELNRQANRFAHGLIAMRLRPGERVMLALPNTPQFLIAYYGILKAGACAVLIAPDLRIDLVRTRLGETGACMLVGDVQRRAEWGALLATEGDSGLRRIVLGSTHAYLGWRERLRRWVRRSARAHKAIVRDADQNAVNDLRREKRLTGYSQVLARGHVFAPEIDGDINDVAVIAYTFGLRSQPLAVPLTHFNLAANALQLRHWLPESRPGDERFLAQQPFHTPYGLTGLVHLAVYLGASLILLPENDIVNLLKTVRRARPTYFPTTPKVVRELTHWTGVRRFGLATIRICAVSGSPLPQEIREEFEKITRGRLLEAYGLAEAAPAVIAMPIATRSRSTSFGVIGLPLPDTVVQVRDLDTGKILPSHAIGELWVRGPQVFGGYLRDDPRYQLLTQQRLQDGWLATGDIASIDEDGYVTIVDRKDNMFVRAGERVFPRQVEEILFEHPAVARAEARVQWDEEGIAHLNVELMLHRNMHISLEDMFKYCAKRLNANALPDSIVMRQQDAHAP